MLKRVEGRLNTTQYIHILEKALLENVWAELKRTVTSSWRHAVRPTRKGQLWDSVLRAWEDLANDTDYFNDLYDSMPNRINTTVDTEGFRTGF